ncbi:hypothetical protein QBC34DRAFT_398555 [Podospora aff. communis PSN243]|uniref:Aminoglycoside phosphotransferase domain-containing protein n=1 Tax=Podospora aff. communis PSN243 TaxID=3040156 RepID=A0AAV9GVS8_9PEZI|nr:hypothetical protein QBC34DRAFT_398555 [Podospora aff. communis PSN243]
MPTNSATGKKPKVFFYADFNLDNLIQLAERLRGRLCTCDTSQTPKVGAYNFAIFLVFDDGVEWVFRAPSVSHAPPGNITERLLASEAATLKYVRKHTTIPVPEVFHYSSTYDNDIGTPFILMSRAPGEPLSKYNWQTHPHEQPGPRRAGRPVTDEEKVKIMHQLGRFARQLFDLRFPTIGSLLEGDEGYYVGECLSPGHIFEDRGTIEDIERDPFHSESEYFVSLAAALRLHAEQLPMGYHVLRAPLPVPQEYSDFAEYHAATDRWNDFVTIGGLAESSANRFQYCLASELLQDTVIPNMINPSACSSAPGFPLYHHDISTQNLFIDDDMNITCIIDWAFCSTVSPAQLLSTPGLPHPRDLVLDEPLTNAFRTGFKAENERSSRKHALSPDDWKRGQMISRFMRLVNQDALQDYHHLQALCLLAQARRDEDDQGGIDEPSLATALVTRAAAPNAVALADELAADDEPESDIREREKRYFDVCGAQRRALAQKVALASSMNPRFVADARLWRCMAKVLDDRGGVELGSGAPGGVSTAEVESVAGEGPGQG